MTPSLHSTSRRPKPRNPPNTNHHSPPSLCKHSASATLLDILILVPLLTSLFFLIPPCFSFLIQIISLSLPFLTNNAHLYYPFAYSLSFLSLLFALLGLSQLCHRHSRKCGKPNCRGLKKSMGFDLLLQSEEKLKLSSRIDDLPLKGLLVVALFRSWRLWDQREAEGHELIVLNHTLQ
ncbi:uncharacterized protein At5g19025 isoform X2 [Amborella trichopoda]|uniref:uncharacterized protein At5g19025 isoform X2 n=1 Tax=Amborella trichopoda TaxID=13333 RepID=UPI0009BDA622|nr:uncharacterized protein At5g19025 isoform X2 [Amborella trichopoda]|eukprot:XP_020527037.1 uncharacterized protein At5g19025 isoform X2 [Amborella trichopoda]